MSPRLTETEYHALPDERKDEALELGNLLNYATDDEAAEVLTQFRKGYTAYGALRAVGADRYAEIHNAVMTEERSIHES